ncbi:MAG: Nif3-like dinuclear metal center hexameric protein [Candidatus Kapabacteria bacterium]|nr:Nif3-like dinuclear metal center hexameric protein [Candidatus Kapabacteria bacterium]
MTLDDFHKTLQRTFPHESAMAGDNVGLQVRSTVPTVSTILTCMEITEAVVDEAVGLGADVIVTFHPLIYSPLLKIDESDRVTRLVARCLRADISVFCVHTAFDAHPQGTNRILANRLQLTPEATISACANVSVPGGGEVGMGLFATCDLDFGELIERISTVCRSPIRYSPPVVERVRRVALVAGSGMSFFADVVGKADVFITADVKYHAFHAARNVIGLVDPGHYEMEQFVAQGIADVMKTQLPDCNVQSSSVVTNPVVYHTADAQIENRLVSVL